MSSPTFRRRSRARLVGAVTIVVALTLAACGAPPSSGDSGGRSANGTATKLPSCPVASLDKAKGKVKVNLWFGGLVDPPVTVLTDMVKAFNKSQDKVEVTSDNQGTSYDEVLAKYEGASGTPDQLPQMIYLEDDMLGEMVDKGQVIPAEACMKADDYDPEQITAAARSSYAVDDVLYPGYMNVSTPIIYYNKVHFQKAGLDPEKPPTTLDEMEAAAKKIKAKGIAPKPISFLANEWFLNTWLAGVSQDAVNNDNGRTKPATKATFDTPEMRKILTDLSRMNSEGLLNVFPVTNGKIDHYLALISEQSSMLIETSTASGTIAQALGGELKDTGGIKIDPAALDSKKIVPGSGEFPGLQAPGKVYASGGAFFIMNSKGGASPEQQAASWEFYKYMLQPENAKTWHITGGYLPVVKSIVDDPDVQEFQDSSVSGQLLAPAAKQLAEADPDQAGPLIGPYSQYKATLRSMLEAVLFNHQDPAKAAAAAQAKVTKILQDYNGG
jgi:sn-glycerol 3-phosphate transport system substrate-binding protein